MARLWLLASILAATVVNGARGDEDVFANDDRDEDTLAVLSGSPAVSGLPADALGSPENDNDDEDDDGNDDDDDDDEADDADDADDDDEDNDDEDNDDEDDADDTDILAAVSRGRSKTYRVGPEDLKHATARNLRRLKAAFRAKYGRRMNTGELRRKLERAVSKYQRRRKMGLGKHLIPTLTQGTRGASSAASALPSDPKGPAGVDHFAVSPAHHARLAGTGWAGLGSAPGWYLPHQFAYSSCDPAIHRDCPVRSPALHPVSQGHGAFPVKVTPTGWWTFHPALSARGTADPIPSPVAAPAHSAAHYYGYAHPGNAGALLHAGSADPHAAYYFPAGASGPAYTRGPWTATAPLATGPGSASDPSSGLITQSARDAGPTAFAPPVQLGPGFLPPHMSASPSSSSSSAAARGAAGPSAALAPASPFGNAPLHAVLRSMHAAASGAPAASDPRRIAQAASQDAPFLVAQAHGARSADPGHAGAAKGAGARVADRRNGGKFTRDAFEKPSDRMAPGPPTAGQKPAPDDP